jgi:hypothetical protein
LESPRGPVLSRAFLRGGYDGGLRGVMLASVCANDSEREQCE